MSAIYRTTGTYLGFISNGYLFSRDGEYLGWIDGQYAWDASGVFRGQVWANKYIILNLFTVRPVPKPPIAKPASPALPPPPPNIAAVALPPGWTDSF